MTTGNLKRFQVIEKEFFYGWIDRNPILATSLGFHRYNAKLPDATWDKVQDDIKFLKRYLNKFQSINPHDLPFEKKLDHELAIYLLNLWIFKLDVLRYWEKIPEAPFIIGECIYQILGRNYAPLEERLQSIIVRLHKLPKLIKQSITKLKKPVTVFIENELETITRLAGFFYSLKEIGRENLKQKDFYIFSKAIENVQDAIEGLCDRLIIDILPEASEQYYMSDYLFSRLLHHRGIDEAPKGLLKSAEDEFKPIMHRLKNIARLIKKKAPVEDARDIIRSKCPANFEACINFARQTVKKTREFIIATNFATLPKSEVIYVVETPSYLRHIVPFGAYWPPGRFESTQEGYYFLTPPDCEGDKLKEHNYASLSNMTVHEAYPGHHLQLICSNSNSSLIRSLCRDPELVEGWAHYCEEKFKELGFDDTLETNFMQILDELWRSIRVVIDVRLSTGRFSPKEAIAYLAEYTGMQWPSAEAEIRRYLITPSYQLSYLTGKQKLKKLQKKVKALMDADYNDKFFHDTILYSGSLPLRFITKIFWHKIGARNPH